MLIYYFLILLVGLVALLSKNVKDEQKRNKIVIGLACLGIFFIQALRAEFVGTDLRSYLPAFQMVDSINIFAGEKLFNYEIGYLLYSQFFSTLNFNTQWYLSIVAITIIGPIAYTWYKNSKMPGLSVFIYISIGFFTFSFSGLRQAIALAITFVSFKFIQERSLLKFLLCVILAMSFHLTAVIFVLAFPLYKIRVKPIHYVPIILGLVIIFIYRTKLFLSIFRLYRGVAGEVVKTNAYTMLIIMILVLLLALIFGSKNINDFNFNSYKNYMLVAILIQILATQSNTIMRAGYYYFIFITLLIPDVFKNQLDQRIRIFGVGTLIVALLYFFKTTTGNGYLGVSPYQFYW